MSDNDDNNRQLGIKWINELCGNFTLPWKYLPKHEKDLDSGNDCHMCCPTYDYEHVDGISFRVGFRLREKLRNARRRLQWMETSAEQRKLVAANPDHGSWRKLVWANFKTTTQ
jgi:hypothetical protein